MPYEMSDDLLKKVINGYKKSYEEECERLIKDGTKEGYTIGLIRGGTLAFEKILKLLD